MIAPKVIDLNFKRPPRVKVAIVQPEMREDHFRVDRDLLVHNQPAAAWSRVQPLLTKLAAQSRTEVPTLIVLPELSLCKDSICRVQRWAKKRNAVVVAGTHYVDMGLARYSTCPIIVHGRRFDTHKQRPSPFELSAVEGNSLSPGQKVQVLRNTPVGNLAVAICADFLDDDFMAGLTRACPDLDFLCVTACQRETSKYSNRLHSFVDRNSNGVYALYANLDFQTYGDGHSAIFGVMDHTYHAGLKRAGYSDLTPEHKIAESRTGESHIVCIASLHHKRPRIPRTTDSSPNMEVVTVQPNPRQSELFPDLHNKIQFVGFDLDGTLVRFPSGHLYSWSAVFEALSIPQSVRQKHHRRYLAGEITYADWCHIVAELFRKKGLTREIMRKVAAMATVAQNLNEQVIRLKRNGIESAIISGGIDTILYDCIRDHKSLFKYQYINKSQYTGDGEFTGFIPTPHDFEGKAEAIAIIAKREGISVNNIAYVGDSINDMRALGRAGLAISFSATDAVKDAAHAHIGGHDLRYVVDCILEFNRKVAATSVPGAIESHSD